MMLLIAFACFFIMPPVSTIPPRYVDAIPSVNHDSVPCNYSLHDAPPVDA